MDRRTESIEFFKLGHAVREIGNEDSETKARIKVDALWKRSDELGEMCADFRRKKGTSNGAGDGLESLSALAAALAIQAEAKIDPEKALSAADKQRKVTGLHQGVSQAMVAGANAAVEMACIMAEANRANFEAAHEGIKRLGSKQAFGGPRKARSEEALNTTRDKLRLFVAWREGILEEVASEIVAVKGTEKVQEMTDNKSAEAYKGFSAAVKNAVEASAPRRGAAPKA